MRDSSLDKMYKNTNAENMLETAFFFFLKPCFFSKSFLFSYILMPEVQEIFFCNCTCSSTTSTAVIKAQYQRDTIFLLRTCQSFVSQGRKISPGTTLFFCNSSNSERQRKIDFCRRIESTVREKECKEFQGKNQIAKLEN